jgi:CRISPR-associated protein Csa1
MFFTWDDVVQISREIRKMPREELDEELRGWNWGSSVLASTRKALLGISDITSGFCETGRDVYLRYNLKIRERDNPMLQNGRLIHDIFGKAIEKAKYLIYAHNGELDGEIMYQEMMDNITNIWQEIENKYTLLSKEHIEWILKKLWSEAARTYSSALDKVKSRSPYLKVESLVSATIPITTEFPINGEYIGLSRTLRIDALLYPGILVEIKTRQQKPTFDLALAGYALAFESQYEIPVDHGILLYIHIDWKNKKIYTRPEIVPISAKLRTEFIELRDERKNIIIYNQDPGLPQKCSPECPFLYYCRGETQ